MAQTTSEFMGIDGFIWFVGVVEDRQDPDKLGRVRVRCLGFHTENITDLPTADLPWAHIMHPVTDPSMHGLGNTPAFMVEGSWVIGFFRDASEKQYPIVIGTLPGIPVKRNIGVGFSDTRQEGVYGPYPSTDGLLHSGHRIGEPDTSKLARGIESEKHLALQRRRQNRLIAIPMATRPSMTATVAGDTSERLDNPEKALAEALADDENALAIFVQEQADAIALADNETEVRSIDEIKQDQKIEKAEKERDKFVEEAAKRAENIQEEEGLPAAAAFELANNLLDQDVRKAEADLEKATREATPTRGALEEAKRRTAEAKRRLERLLKERAVRRRSLEEQALQPPTLTIPSK